MVDDFRMFYDMALCDKKINLRIEKLIEKYEKNTLSQNVEINLTLFLTIPIATPVVNAPFTALKRVTNYLRNSFSSQANLDVWAILFMEYDLVKEIVLMIL